LLASTLTLATVSCAEGETAYQQCERLAAHPWDEGVPAGKGVRQVEDIDATRAIPACTRAIEEIRKAPHDLKEIS
jgi:hypothetical protein